MSWSFEFGHPCSLTQQGDYRSHVVSEPRSLRAQYGTGVKIPEANSFLSNSFLTHNWSRICVGPFGTVPFDVATFLIQHRDIEAVSSHQR